MDEAPYNPLLASKRPAPPRAPARQKFLRRTKRLRDSLRRCKRLRKTISSSWNKVSATSILCSRCRRVDWTTLTTILPTCKNPREIQINATREELLDSSCRICQMIGTMVPPDTYKQSFKLVAYPSWSVTCPLHKRPAKEMAVHDSTILHFSHAYHHLSEPSGMIGLSFLNEKECFGIKPIKADTVDFEWLNQCFKHCLKNHDTRCNHNHDTHAQNKMELRHRIRLINCKSQYHEIIDAPPKCRYAALSYVWGKPQPEDSTAFSQVVVDAIKVTISLGLQYLWVDKHVCILVVKIDGLYHFLLTNQYPVYKPT